MNSSPRPTIFLEWVIIPAAIFAWRRGEHKVALEVVGLVAIAWVIGLIGTLRGLKLEYFIITDPLIIVAGAWLFVQVSAL